MLSRIRRGRRGQAAIFGALFFLMIAFLLVNFLFEIHRVQTSVSKLNLEREKEELEITDVIPGEIETQQKNREKPDGITVTLGSTEDDVFSSGVIAEHDVAEYYLISNMNFTGSSEGWVFTRAYSGSHLNSMEAEGHYTTEAVGSPSGAGSLCTCFLGNPQEGNVIRAVMNWTTHFYVGSELAEGVNSTLLSIGSRSMVFHGVAENATVKVLLNNSILWSRSVGGVDYDWIEDTRDISYSWSEGWYEFVVMVQVGLVHSEEALPMFMLYLDDIGITLKKNAYVTEWSALFDLNLERTCCKRGSLTLATEYRLEAPVLQWVYVRDFTRSAWVLLGTSRLSINPTTVRYSLSSDHIGCYLSSSGEVEVRIYSVSEENFTCKAEFISLEAVSQGLEAQNKAVILLRNLGSLGIRIVSVWIICPTEHRRIAVDLYLAPESTGSLTVNQPLHTDVYTLKVVTERGNILVYNVEGWKTQMCFEEETPLWLNF